MTTGHKHRLLRVKENGRAMRFLSKPRWHSTNLDRVDPSPYPYGQCKVHDDCWYLSILSVLHRWTGLTLRYGDDD